MFEIIVKKVSFSKFLFFSKRKNPIFTNFPFSSKSIFWTKIFWDFFQISKTLWNGQKSIIFSKWNLYFPYHQFNVTLLLQFTIRGITSQAVVVSHPQPRRPLATRIIIIPRSKALAEVARTQMMKTAIMESITKRMIVTTTVKKKARDQVSLNLSKRPPNLLKKTLMMRMKMTSKIGHPGSQPVQNQIRTLQSMSSSLE